MMVKKLTVSAFALALFATAGAATYSQTAFAAATPEEVKICKETISEMTGGKPPAEAVKLCEQGKLNEAIEKAMAGG